MMHPSRQAYVDEDPPDVEMGIDLMNIPIDRDYDLHTAGGSGIAPQRASAILSQFDRKRRAAAIVVPTDDGRVRAKLREMGEPVTLFGEGLADRRDRLRELLTDEVDERGSDGTPLDASMQDAGAADPADQDEEFYTEGLPELLEARRKIARYSLPRAQARIARQKEDSNIPLRTHIKHRKVIKEKLSGFELFGTQIVGERPVSIVRFSPDGETIATGTWSGSMKLLSVPNLEEKTLLRGHTGIVGGIAWLPKATLQDSNITSSVLNLASSSGGQGGANEIHLWSLEQDTPLSTLQGHSDRVCRIAFSPSGEYLASASFDTTWRLWDVETTTELLLQEGHSRQVYTVAFNSDGSLLASGGFDSIGRIWDLRSGRTVMILDGHIREIFSLDWGVDGYRVLSGSGDGWVKCWDIRAVRSTGGIGAHNGNVSDLRWYKGLDSEMSSITPSSDPHLNQSELKMMTEPGSTFNAGNENPGSGVGTGVDGSVKQEYTPRKAGTFFVSAGFDKNINVYSADDWALARQLSGHSGNVLSCDVDSHARWIVSGGHDRTVKLWGREDGLGV